MTAAEDALAAGTARIGVPEGSGEWFEIDRESQSSLCQ